VSTKLFLIGLFAMTALGATGCAADTGEGDDEPVGESEDRLLAGRRLSTGEIARHLRAAGFPENVIGPMVCTAKYESSYYERASNKNRNGSTDRGLFQINSIHLGGTRGCPTNGTALFDAATNAKCAYAVYKMQGIRAWYGYRKHATECNGTRAPASSGVVADPDDSPDTSTADYGNEQGEEVGPGGCWSGTLQDTVEAGVCVQSKYDSIWFQCHNGKWYRGVTGNNGPYGTCAASHPL
jgi:lysozyme C